jgi:hypothetical protein
MVEVEPDPKSNSIGLSHTSLAWFLAIMDFPQPHCRAADQNIEPYNNVVASMVQTMKLHEKSLHVEIDSSSNPMDSL